MSNKPRLLYVAVCLLTSCFGPIQRLWAQQVIEKDILIDSIPVKAYFLTDTGFVNFLSQSENTKFRQRGNMSTVSSMNAEGFKTALLEDDSLLSRFRIAKSGVQIISSDKGKAYSSIDINPSGLEVNAIGTWFNGEWIKMPQVSSSVIDSTKNPEGSIQYAGNTRSLVMSDGFISRPAYWEYPDSNDLNPSVLLNKWNSDIGYNNLPSIRVRHPLNVSGVKSGNISRDQDFTITPYEYGMAIDYNGTVECWVGEFSIHKGLHWRVDPESNGNAGWGGILWVGDDLDHGGLRATSRMQGDILYSEISSENFDTNPHGPLRFRVVNNDELFQFVTGRRGSTDLVLSINNHGDTAVIETGENKDFGISTGGSQRLLITKDGNIGAGVADPKSTIDVESPFGYNQLRLRKTFTPENSRDTRGELGDIAHDENYLYVKTSEGWKRTKLESF